MNLLRNQTATPILSICIPTYNRARYLENCLESICDSWTDCVAYIEVCISDNASTDDTREIVRLASDRIPIRYNRNSLNEGMARNFLKVVSMAKGDYVWLIGDDDLLMPRGLTKILKLLKDHQEVDFFYVNAYHLNAKYLEQFTHPFSTSNLPVRMERFSKSPKPRVLKFFELVSPTISFDFLGGIFLAVFRREGWVRSAHVLEEEALSSCATFSHFDNTFPHVKIWAHAFRSSRAYFNPDPAIVCITGIREWASMTPLIMSVRLPEALKIYRDCGMSWRRYIFCMNFALRSCWADLACMYMNRQIYKFPLPRARVFFSSLLYPGAYVSVLFIVARTLRALLRAHFLKLGI